MSHALPLGMDSSRLCMAWSSSRFQAELLYFSVLLSHNPSLPHCLEFLPSDSLCGGGVETWQQQDSDTSSVHHLQMTDPKGPFMTLISLGVERLLL